jgi:hypothetical protein
MKSIAAKPLTTQPAAAKKVPKTRPARRGLTPPRRPNPPPAIRYRPGYERGFAVTDNKTFMRRDLSTGAKCLYRSLESYRFVDRRDQQGKPLRQPFFYMSMRVAQELCSASAQSVLTWREELQQAQLYDWVSGGGRFWARRKDAPKYSYTGQATTYHRQGPSRLCEAPGVGEGLLGSPEGPDPEGPIGAVGRDGKRRW